MNTTSTIAIETATLPVPGATLSYDVRMAEGSAHRPVLAIGSPMGAAGFATLAGYFPDRTIITYDPRGVERSTKDEPATQSTPQQHGDDLHRIIDHLGLGPVDVFASSGGAVNALALVTTHPDDVRLLVAHEPPLVGIVADRGAASAAVRAVDATYRQHGRGAGMAHFIALVMHDGPFTAEWAEQPGPDPQMFGMPARDDGDRTDPLLGQNLLTSTGYRPDIPALRAAATEVVVAVGNGSGGTLARRAGEALAAALGTAPVIFPGDHAGFLGGEYGQMGEPDAFAAKLREVLDAIPG